MKKISVVTPCFNEEANVEALYLRIKEIFRKKDFYVALILSAVVLFYASSLQFYNVENIYRYLMESKVRSGIMVARLEGRGWDAEGKK